MSCHNRLTADLISRNLDVINKYLSGLRVTQNVNEAKRSRQIINKLIPKKAKDDFFDVEGNAISVFQYFTQIIKYSIQFPDFPLLWVGPKERSLHVPLEVSRRGSKTRQILFWIVAESRIDKFLTISWVPAVN